jgi:NitT/TauT family transport system ATP-binding protein
VLFVTHNVEEAVFLADKVIVLSDIPARIKRVIEIDIGRPRKTSIKSREVFRGYVKWIKEILKQ